MADVATLLDATLKSQGIPIVGVSIGTTADRATWVVAYDQSATAQQRIDGEAIRATFDATAPAVVNAQLDRDIDSMVTAVVKGLSAALVEVELGRPVTAADAATVRAKFTRVRALIKFVVNNGL